MPWAYRGYGSRYRPTRHGCAPQVVIEPVEADVVRRISRLLVEEHLRCRQMTTRLNASHTPTPSGRNQVWHPATVSTLLTNCVYAGQARDNDRQLVVPSYRKTAEVHLHSLKTGRHYRPETAWVWSDAPAIISDAWFAKAQVPWQRHAELAHKRYQPTSRRYMLRRLVPCGACGLGMVCNRQRSICKTYEYLYDACRGHAPLRCGRLHPCPSRRVRADRLDAVVWQAPSRLWQTPTMTPRLHQTWAQAEPQHGSALAAPHTQLLRRWQRLERPSQRLLDAYQPEIISLNE